MQTLLKQSIIGGLSFLLLTGIAFSVGSSEPSVFQTEAISRTKIAKFGSANLTSGWSQTGYSTLATDYVKFRTNNSNFVETTAKTSLIDASEQFTSSLTVTYKVGSFGGTGTSGTLRAELLDSNNTTLTSSTGSFTLSNSTESYAQGSTINLSLPSNLNDIDKFKLILNTNVGFTDSIYLRLEELTITYSSELNTTYNDATNYANTFISSTNNKENCFSNDNWTSLGNSFDGLSADAQNYFRNTSTNTSIVNARARYNYLRAFNNTLTDFINAA